MSGGLPKDKRIDEPWSIAFLLAMTEREDDCSRHAIGLKYRQIC